MLIQPTLFLFGLVAVTAAKSVYTGKATSEKDCKSTEFFYSPKSCCLPHGGPQKIPSPPAQKQCPPTNWYWNYDTSCCVPNHPPPKSPPPPQSRSEWEWNSTSQCCEPKPTPSKPAPKPKPSQAPYQKETAHENQKNGKDHYKRNANKSRALSPCPRGMAACPMTALVGDSTDYECLDTFAELTSCGGCASTGAGQNCGLMYGAWNVGCEFGECKIYTCAGGFTKSLDGLSCVPL